MRGCQDGHSEQAPFLFREVVQYPFGPDGRPVTVPQYTLLGMAEARAKELAALATP